MDDVVSAALARLSLVNFKVVEVQASTVRGVSMGEGGHVISKTNSKFGKHKTDEGVFLIESKVTSVGYNKKEQQVFSIAVAVRCMLQSEAPITEAMSNSELFRQNVDKRAYLIAIINIQQLAMAMNLPGIKLPPEHERQVEEVPAKRKSATKKIIKSRQSA